MNIDTKSMQAVDWTIFLTV